MCSLQESNKIISEQIAKSIEENKKINISEKQTICLMCNEILVIKIVKIITTYLVVRFKQDCGNIYFDVTRVFFLPHKDDNGNITNKGTFFIKCVSDNQSSVIVHIISTHVLDRINLRIDDMDTKTIRFEGSNFPDRIDALAEFIEGTADLNNLQYYEKDNDDLTIFCDHGAFMGESKLLFETQYACPFMFIFIKTYVSNKMLHSEQIRLKEESLDIREFFTGKVIEDTEQLLKDLKEKYYQQEKKEKNSVLTKLLTNSLKTSETEVIDSNVKYMSEEKNCQAIYISRRRFNFFYSDKKYFLALVGILTLYKNGDKKIYFLCGEDVTKLEPPFPVPSNYWISIFPELDTEDIQFLEAYNSACKDSEKVLNELVDLKFKKESRAKRKFGEKIFKKIINKINSVIKRKDI
jgi:hypothetical protein